MNFEQVLMLRRSSRKGVFLEMSIIDMCGGNILAGLMLSQILYWHEPDDNSKTRLRVCKNGKYWLAKKHSSWQEECRLTEDQARAALDLLKKMGFIDTMVARFDGNPTTHIALVKDKFTADYLSQCGLTPQNQLGHSPEPNGLQPSSLTENTTETTLLSLQSEELVPKSTIIEPLPVTTKSRSTGLGRDTQERERSVEELYRVYREVYDSIPLDVDIHQPAYAKVKPMLTALHLDCKATPDQLRKALKKLLSTNDKKYVTAKTLLENWQALAYSFTAKTPTIPHPAPPPPTPTITEIDTTPYTQEEQLALRKSMWEAMWIERKHAASNGYFPDYQERMAYDASTDAQKAQSRAQGYVEGFCPVFEEYMVEI